MAATVGVAFGTQNDITTEAADAVVLEPALGKIDELMHIGQRMRRVALQSALGGMAASVIGMVAASLGFLPPLLGSHRTGSYRPYRRTKCRAGGTPDRGFTKFLIFSSKRVKICSFKSKKPDDFGFSLSDKTIIDPIEHLFGVRYRRRLELLHL